MVDKIITQDKTSTSQNMLQTSKIVDLSASTTCRRHLLRCCDPLAESVSRCKMFGVEFLFFRGEPCPRRGPIPNPCPDLMLLSIFTD